MKKLKAFIFFLVAISLSISNSYGQDIITIQFDKDYKLLESNAHGFMKLNKLNKDTTIDFNGEQYSVTLPKQFNVQDAAIGLNYYNGWSNPKAAKNVAFLFEDATSQTPLCYVDYNNNLNFRDDGAPILFNKDSATVIFLKNEKVDSGLFPIRFYYPKMDSLEKANSYKWFSGKGHIEGSTELSIDHWLADQRMNYRTVKTNLTDNEIYIGIYDYNCNGLYNDKGEDRILIGDASKNTISGRSDKGAIVFTDTTLLLLNNQLYAVKEIDAIGTYIKLQKSTKSYNSPIGVGDNIASIKLSLVSGQVKSIGELQEKDKYLLLDFWGTWCVGCSQQLPYLKELYEKNKNKLQIIGLNYGDRMELIKNFNKKHDLNWKQTVATESIISNLRIDGFPNYLLLDKNGTIVIQGATLEEIEKEIK